MKGFLIFLYILIRKLFSLVYNPKIERDIKSNYIVKSAEVVPIVRNPIPKVIWMYWDDPNVPDLVLQCFFNISKYNPRYKVHLLNAVTINDFIDIKFSSSVEINPAHKSDLIRLCLLSKYGGVWIDATTIMFEDISWVQNIYKDISVDFVGYYHRKSTINYDRPVIENWFMASPIESKFISMWLNELMVILEKGSSGLYEDISNSADFSDIKQNIHNPSYMVTYLLQQRVQKKVGLSFYLKCAEDEAFLIQENNNWKSYKTAVDLSIKNNTGLNIIKLTSLDRFYVNKILARNMQCKSSIIGRLINEC